jgi:hypothetical protein
MQVAPDKPFVSDIFDFSRHHGSPRPYRHHYHPGERSEPEGE